MLKLYVLVELQLRVKFLDRRAEWNSICSALSQNRKFPRQIKVFICLTKLQKSRYVFWSRRVCCNNLCKVGSKKLKWTRHYSRHHEKNLSAVHVIKSYYSFTNETVKLLWFLGMFPSLLHLIGVLCWLINT